jgi:PEP-CTERM motif
MKTKLVLALALLSPFAASAQLNLLVNGGFEIPPSAPGPDALNPVVQINESFVNGWHTTATDSLIELWQSGYTRTDGGVSRTYNAATGAGFQDGQTQFAELNATQESALYQDVTFGAVGLVDFFYLQRGRLGDLAGQVDSLRLTILYAGADGNFSSTFNNSTGAYSLVGDDSIAFTTTSSANYAGGWQTVQGNDVFTSVAGGKYRFAYGSMSAFSGNGGDGQTFGNFIDNAAFGFDLVTGPVPEPSTYGLFGAAALLGMVAIRRIRKKSAELTS